MLQVPCLTSFRTIVYVLISQTNIQSATEDQRTRGEGWRTTWSGALAESEETKAGRTSDARVVDMSMQTVSGQVDGKRSQD